jgi:hypothetical protein
LRGRDDFFNDFRSLENQGEEEIFTLTPLSNFLSSAYASLTKFSLSLKGREENKNQTNPRRKYGRHNFRRNSQKKW